MTRPRLRLVGGVCAGFSDHTGVPVRTVRTVTLLLSLCGGAGVLLYVWLWVTTPTTVAADHGAGPRLGLAGSTAAAAAVGSFPGRTAALSAGPSVGRFGVGSSAASDAPPARSAPVTEILLGVALLAAGVALVASRLGAGIPLAVIIPGIVVLAGTALAWRQFADIRSGAAQRSSALLVRALGALVLVAVGILLFFVTGDSPNVWTVVIAAVSVLLGVAVVIAPWLIRLSHDLADERAARVRELERAEIAAHLHDSVLQTLALIQQKAGPQSEAARLARAQERELREWLFTGSEATTIDLAAELRRLAGVIEQDFAVQFDVVTAGASPEDVPDALVAAAREAMLNAARHAGGLVSIYLESGPSRIELSVTDRGPGFSLDDIPDDRLGVKESIVGRMRRVGGTATVRRGPGGTGTEIVLVMPVSAAMGETAAGEQPPSETGEGGAI
ncbi:ATP-binding protein [Glaciibacter psychrotolerans]|uniref:Signal transduction histidine kinase/phage shock protein PspC (Stress-responsive transcriptional regulator) n=1 Tax=Glaciibacter psychrotolerans TaxID=670054 RepID=A0A7Z0EFH8_9MICO|nr:ATP-binding protein [Leifsonia psychrotolerans]NYJ20681.1 signal transduction histidine kinase/phage shock protein PspC (stress-responsive transcriptional regulator) [Leifsonia psychrotolerans]